MKYRVVAFALLAVSITLVPTSASAKKQKWEVTYPDGKKEKFEYDDQSCQMVGWQHKINFSATFDILKRYQGSAGFSLTNDHVRELDDLEKDFGLQFEGLCKDYMIGVYRDRQALYDCRRGNINNALSDLRELSLLLTTVSTIQDAAAKKDSVSTILDKYKQHINDPCTKNALQAQTDSLDFGGNETEKSVVLTNVGYFDISWSASSVPRGFLPYPPGGALARNNSLPLVVYRLADAPAPPPRTFLIKDNQNDELIIHLKLSADDVVQTMKLRIQWTLANQTQTEESVEQAASVVRSFYSKTPAEVVYWVTGELLDQLGDSKDASKSLSKAGQINPKLEDHPQFKLDVAKASLLSGDVDGAKKIVGQFLEGRPVVSQTTYKLEPPEFYENLYEQLGDGSSAAALSNSLKLSGYDMHIAAAKK